MFVIASHSGREKHEFIGQPEEVSEESVVFSSEFVRLRVPLPASAIYQYSGPREAPPKMREAFADIDFTASLRTNRSMLLLGIGKLGNKSIAK